MTAELTNLYLRKVDHHQAPDNYRVVLKTDHDGEFEIGSIGVKHFTSTDTRWTWGIDTVIPMRDMTSEGDGRDLKDCMRKFKLAWKTFVADEANATAFFDMKRTSRRT